MVRMHVADSCVTPSSRAECWRFPLGEQLSDNLNRVETAQRTCCSPEPRRHGFRRATPKPAGAPALRAPFSSSRRRKRHKDRDEDHPIKDHQQRPPPIQQRLRFTRRTHFNILLFPLPDPNREPTARSICSSPLLLCGRPGSGIGYALTDRESPFHHLLEKSRLRQFQTRNHPAQ